MVLEPRELGGSQGEMNLEWEVGARPCKTL